MESSFQSRDDHDSEDSIINYNLHDSRENFGHVKNI